MPRHSLLLTLAFLCASGSSLAQTTATIPHFACGGGWSTTVTFTHRLWYPFSSATDPWRLRFVVDVRTPDDRPLFSAVESLPNSSGTYVQRFTCDTEDIQTGRIDFVFFDSDIKTFNQPQKRMWPMALLSYHKHDFTMETGLHGQFLAGVDTITGEDSQGNTTWKRFSPWPASIPILHNDGSKYGVAVHNHNQRPASVRVLFFDMSGSRVYERTFTLQARETKSWTVWEVGQDFLGSMLVYNAETYGSFALGLAVFRFSPTGQFTNVFSGY